MEAKMKLKTIEIMTELIPGVRGWKKTAASDIPPEQLNARTPFPVEVLERLRRSRVGVLGLGSGGGKIALDLAKAGVGEFVLVDPAFFQVHNSARHICGINDAQRYKVEAVSERMLLHNPHLMIYAYAGDPWNPADNLSFSERLGDCNLIIAATDRTEIQLAINEAAWTLRIPAVFGGCYEAARGGEVLFTLPGEGTPCLACLRAGLAQPPAAGPFDYSAAQGPEDYRGEPGISAAVDLVTDVETQIALGILLRGTGSALAELISPEYNFVLVGGALAAGYYRFRRPFQIFWQPLAGPRPDCEVCTLQPDRVPPDLSQLDEAEELPEL
jgi:hypothetical protein